jgi:disintegrin and metalloproteinase domain-containing protein 12
MIEALHKPYMIYTPPYVYFSYYLQIYKVEGVRIVVVDVVTWTMDDPIKITSDAQDLLSNFRDYSHNLPQRYDSAMLFTGGQFEGSTIGIAFTATMCEVRDSAVGVVQDGGGEMNQLISTTSHELGHIFSMGHDTEDCTCVGEQSNTCIMQDIIGYPPPKTWSSCSVETLRTSLAGDQGLCLNNEPATTVKDAACGNGIQEEGEACDCGSVDECTDPCCNTTSCQLVAGAECRAGLCCKDNCQLRNGSVCRPERNECDIEEYCTGDHADCPTDSFLQNLTPCMKNKSYCFLGDCQTRDKQCQHHFGTNDGIDECYTEVNTQGTVYGHCGFDDTQYLPCIARNALCGQLQCADGGELKTTPGFPVTFTLNSPSFTCKSVTTDAGTDEISPGLIRDGTKCGEEMVCFRTKCVSVGSFDIPSCPVDNSGEVCSGNGQCNNQNQCSCFVGFTGQLCNQVAGGAKPTGQANKGAIAGAVIAVFVVLAIGGATTAVIVYFVLRSKTTFNLTNILRSLHSSNDQDFRAERHPSQPVSHHNSRANVSSAASSSKSETHRPTRPTAVSSTPGKVQASSANVSRHIAAFEQKSGASSDKPPQNCSKPPQRPPPPTKALPARCKRPAAPERPAPPTSVSVLNPSKFSRAKQTPALKDVQRHGSTSKDT